MDRSQDPRVLLEQARAHVEKPRSSFSTVRKFVSTYDGKFDDYKEAIELYKQAAVTLVKQRQQVQAAQAYEQAAELEFRVKRGHEANETLQRAVSNYGDADGAGKARCLERIIAYYIDTRGSFSSAASYAKTLAGVYEKQLKDETKALEAYQNSADWIGQPFSRRALLPNIAELASKNGDYIRGAENWEETARIFCDQNKATMIPSAYPCLFKAGLCRLIGGDMVAISHSLSSYCQMATGFQGTPEYRTLSEMVDIIERGESPEKFEEVATNYWPKKYIKEDDPKDPYLVMMFNRNKDEIKERPEDFS